MERLRGRFAYPLPMCWKLQPRWSWQTVKKVYKQYIDDFAAATKPYLRKARETMMPYTKETVIAYGKFLQSASKYHDQSLMSILVQDGKETEQLESIACPTLPQPNRRNKISKYNCNRI